MSESDPSFFSPEASSSDLQIPNLHATPDANASLALTRFYSHTEKKMSSEKNNGLYFIIIHNRWPDLSILFPILDSFQSTGTIIQND